MSKSIYNNQPDKLPPHKPDQEDQGETVGHHQHVEHPVPVVVPGQRPRQERSDGGSDTSGPVNDGGDRG